MGKTDKVNLQEDEELAEEVRKYPMKSSQYMETS